MQQPADDYASEPQSAPKDMAGDSHPPDEGDHEVWQSFEQSVAYMSNLSALYNDAFLVQPSTKSVAVTTAHVEAAKCHAREAIDLLASNLLNASTAVVAQMEDQEERLAALNAKVDRVKALIHEQQRARDQQSVERFNEVIGATKNQPTARIVATNKAVTETTATAPQLNLSLAGPLASSSASSHLYF